MFWVVNPKYSLNNEYISIFHLRQARLLIHIAMAQLAAAAAPTWNAFLVVILKGTQLRAADAGVLGLSDPYCIVTTPTAPETLNAKTDIIMVCSSNFWNN